MSRALGRFIRRNRVRIAAWSCLGYLVLIVLTVVFFPANTLWTALMVLVVGMLGAVLQLADLLEDE